MRPIHEQQAVALHDPEAEGPIWVSRVSVPAPPEDDARQALFRAIDRLVENEMVAYARPRACTVHSQWTASRSVVGSKEPEPSLSEDAKYRALMGTELYDLTIFYVHAGGFAYGLLLVYSSWICKTQLTGSQDG